MATRPLLLALLVLAVLACIACSAGATEPTATEPLTAQDAIDQLGADELIGQLVEDGELSVDMTPSGLDATLASRVS